MVKIEPSPSGKSILKKRTHEESSGKVSSDGTKRVKRNESYKYGQADSKGTYKKFDEVHMFGWTRGSRMVIANRKQT